MSEEIEVIFCHQTNDAIGVWEDEEDKAKNEPTWFPKSCSRLNDLTPMRGDVVVLTTTEEMLLMKGFI